MKEHERFKLKAHCSPNASRQRRMKCCKPPRRCCQTPRSRLLWQRSSPRFRLPHCRSQYRPAILCHPNTKKTGRSSSTFSEYHQIRARQAALGRPPQTTQFAKETGYRHQRSLAECRRIGVADRNSEPNAGSPHRSCPPEHRVALLPEDRLPPVTTNGFKPHRIH